MTDEGNTAETLRSAAEIRGKRPSSTTAGAAVPLPRGEGVENAQGIKNVIIHPRDDLPDEDSYKWKGKISMNLKKKLKKFFTLKRRANDGFTLVELIVVIAILAILAGVGSVGYAGYIKAANKKADMTLVGNVMRAIETGTYSYAIELNEIVQVSESAKLPVGFIVLTQDGGTTMQSASTTVALNAKDPCVIEEVNFYKATSAGTDTNKYNFLGSKTRDVYKVEVDSTVRICTKHSVINYQNFYVWDSGSGPDPKDSKWNSTEKSYAVLDGSSLIEDGANGHEQGATPSAGSQYQVQVENGQYVSTNNSGAMYDALVMAFGENPNLSLKYDQWNVSSIPSFWSNATGTWGNVERLANMMQKISSYGVADAMGMNEYESSAHIVYSVAQAVEGSFADKQAFVDQWASYGEADENSNLYGGDNFGIQVEGREFYSAMRGSYNNCVASYVKQHHSAPNAEAHANALASYGESAGDLVEDKLGGGILGSIAGSVAGAVADENFPRQLCASAFTTDEGKSYMGAAAGCAECQQLYNDYITSGTDKIDAAAVYDTFMTAADTDPTILGGTATDANGNAIGFFSYYANQLKEYEGLYKTATEMTKDKSAIVIQVFYEGGKLVCDVAPYDANPRND